MKDLKNILKDLAESLDDMEFQLSNCSRNIMKDVFEDIGNISDGYHTYNELYHHRMILFSIICRQNKDKSWRSKLHADGTMFPNYFIVGIDTSEGQFSYHYHEENWSYFQGIGELDNAPPWDGHQSSDITRLLSLKGENL